jgi:acyl carrier protein
MDEAGFRAEIEATLWIYIRDNYLPRHEQAGIGADENLFNCGILDSAGLIAFVVYLEKKFNLKIPDEDLLPENFSSLGSITGYIIRKQSSVPA